MYLSNLSLRQDYVNEIIGNRLIIGAGGVAFGENQGRFFSVRPISRMIGLDNSF
jgi:hypothetical protein